MNLTFQNQTVLITGAASGIGKASALLFAEAGAKVVVSDLNEIKGNETVAEIQKAGGEAVFVQVNVADFESLKNLHETAIRHFGSIDVAVNNAGIGGAWNRMIEYSHSEYSKVMAVNVDGVFYGMQLQIAQMIKQGKGNIVNISSIAGLKGFGMCAAYSASKHAVIGLTKSAALEYARDNIRINAVCPVFTRTPLFEQLFETSKTLEEKLLKNIPLRRYGTPEDIAQAILWISSDQASFITGQALPLDGGMLA
jgi:NAD(P)-dependent dehydrogenase (short-subunit alcohol dehydrogenase family)